MSPKTLKRGRPPRGTTWRRLCAAAVGLPEVSEGTSYGTPALHVRKTLLARLREDGATVAVRIELLDRDVLLEADPKAFFLTDHYRAYPWVLLRLAEVHHGAAVELIEQAWRTAAPAKLVTSHSRDRVHAKDGTGELVAQRRRTTRG